LRSAQSVATEHLIFSASGGQTSITLEVITTVSSSALRKPPAHGSAQADFDGAAQCSCAMGADDVRDLGNIDPTVFRKAGALSWWSCRNWEKWALPWYLLQISIAFSSV